MLGMLFQVNGALAHSYLLLNVHVADEVEQPTWLGIGKREVYGSFLSGRVHLAVNESLILDRVAPSRYYLRHLDFTQTTRGDRRSVDLPALSGVHIKRHTIHYAGDFEIKAADLEPRAVNHSGDVEISSRMVGHRTAHYTGDSKVVAKNVNVNLSAETVRLACSKFPEIMSQHDLVIPVAGKEPIVVTNPCSEPTQPR